MNKNEMKEFWNKDSPLVQLAKDNNIPLEEHTWKLYKDYSYEEILKIVEEFWTKTSIKDNTVIATGKGGVIRYYEQLQGRELTQKEKDNIEEGCYIFEGGIPVKYKL